MGVMRIIFFTIAITMAITIATLSMNNRIGQVKKNTLPSSPTEDLHGVMHDIKPMPSKRLSRFLVQDSKTSRGAHHCHKDNEICYVNQGKNSTCCNNKCMDLSEDKHNCGACNKKCKFTEECCRGECVNIAFDKRHCGRCNHQCHYGEYCVYGLCNYA
ncbi:hypothetical protein SLEP1_g47346 [Rubroshorea leprosula]|uniref:Stigma-specific Stig1 family protein n=1 Tax=Rubroshorea leprosula TaxID=152421 RepID=A0AAV5LQ25_9ROSI|nr:hypothetical protein SLEP1_g47346 [Rubroshorea leprosula]